MTLSRAVRTELRLRRDAKKERTLRRDAKIRLTLSRVMRELTKRFQERVSTEQLK